MSRLGAAYCSPARSPACCWPLLSSPSNRLLPLQRRPPRCPAARAAALPPGSPLIGRPEGNEAAAKLAPVAPPPIPAAADKLPTAQLKLPPGFNIEVYASGIANTRSLRIGDKGTVFVGTRFGNKVTAIVKKDGKTEIKTIAEGLYRPNGLAFTTARSTSPSCRRSPRSTMSRPISTSRRSRR